MSSSAISPTDFNQVLSTFLRPLAPGAHIVVFCHFDADGLAAGAVFGRGLEQSGKGWKVTVLPSGKGENAFETPGAQARIRALRPDALIVTDLGVNALGTLEADGIQVLYVDHHIPEGHPPAGGFVITGYGLDPVPCSAWLAYELMEAQGWAAGLDWVAAVGVLSDLGDKAPWPRLQEVKKRYTAKWLKEAVSQCNAARRAGAFDLQTPLRHLLTDDDPKPLATDPVLAGYRTEVKAALAEARKQAPKFPPKEATGTAPVAIVTIDSPCQIHPLIAQQWSTRLPDRVALSANLGYLKPGFVAISGRTDADISIPQMLRTAFEREGHAPPGNFAHGHPQASGGHLSLPDYRILLRGLGYDAETIERLTAA